MESWARRRATSASVMRRPGARFMGIVIFLWDITTQAGWFMYWNAVLCRVLKGDAPRFRSVFGQMPARGHRIVCRRMKKARDTAFAVSLAHIHI